MTARNSVETVYLIVPVFKVRKKETCSMTLYGYHFLLVTVGIGPHCFSSAKFILVLCLLRKGEKRVRNGKYFSNFSANPHVMGTQKNRLIETPQTHIKLICDEISAF